MAMQGMCSAVCRGVPAHLVAAAAQAPAARQPALAAPVTAQVRPRPREYWATETAQILNRKQFAIPIFCLPMFIITSQSGYYVNADVVQGERGRSGTPRLCIPSPPPERLMWWRVFPLLDRKGDSTPHLPLYRSLPRPPLPKNWNSKFPSRRFKLSSSASISLLKCSPRRRFWGNF